MRLLYSNFFIMPRLNLESRRRVVTLVEKGYSVSTITRRLKEENTFISQQSLYRLMQKFRSCGIIQDLPRRKRSMKLSNEMLQFINLQLQQNDELTSRQLQSSLKEKYPLLNVSLPTIRRARKKLGWVCTKPHYCQLIRDLNKRSVTCGVNSYRERMKSMKM